MSSDIERWPEVSDPVAFESLCLELFKDIWGNCQRNGTKGQRQYGVDLFGRFDGKAVAVQCKMKDGLARRRLKAWELKNEALDARNFTPALDLFIVATTGPSDAKIQALARTLSESNRLQGMFEIQVWSWEHIWHTLYHREGLLKKVASVYWPILSTLPNNGASPMHSAHPSLHAFITGFAFGRATSFLFVPDANNAGILLQFTAALGVSGDAVKALGAALEVRTPAVADLEQRLRVIQHTAFLTQRNLDALGSDWFALGQALHDVVYADQLPQFFLGQAEQVRRILTLMRRLNLDESSAIGMEIVRYVKSIEDDDSEDVVVELLDGLSPLITQHLGFKE